MNSKQQIAVDVDVTASGTRITLMAPTDTGRMGVIYSEFHPMPPAQKQHVQKAVEPTMAMVQAACAAFRMDIPPMQAMHEAIRAALTEINRA